MGALNKVKNAFRTGFENRCLKLLVAAYENAIQDKTISLDWDENDITAQLHKHIASSQLRLNWSIIINREHPLSNKTINKKKGFAAKFPRIDLRFVTINSSQEYEYFFEAKNLKQNNYALKRRYINTGIDNFNSKKYENGCLVGYLLDGDLALTIKGINSLLVKHNRGNEILNKENCRYHNNYYKSSHSNIQCLKHYIFDFTLIHN